MIYQYVKNLKFVTILDLIILFEIRLHIHTVLSIAVYFAF